MIPKVTLSAVTSEETDLVGVAASRVGTTLHGKYQIDQVLGVGGMGIVYAATHRNGKRFAIKLLHPELSSRKDIRTRFLREGYVANAVNHPGVVAVLDDDVAEDGSAFLVMELLDGNTVDALGARPGSRMPLREALGISYQLLDVLDAAHTKSIIHRDIKPANLFVLKDGQVKVLDFGLARLRDATSSLETTRTGEQMGTPAFMAPEQARGDVKNIDLRTDIWAAGATLFTALSGCLVHEGSNARQIMVRAATTPARSLSSLVPDAPAAVVQLLAKALEYDMAARWESAAAMRDAVAAAHESLFGSPQREHLKLLFEGIQTDTETAATVPSPDANSIPVLRDSAVVSASTSTSPDAFSEPATMAQADSAHEHRGMRSGGRPVFVAAGLAAMLVGGASIALYRRTAQPVDAIPSNSSSIGARSAPLGRELSELSSNIRTIDFPSLPAASIRDSVSSTSPQSPNLQTSHGAQRLPPKLLAPAAPEKPPMTTQPPPKPGMAPLMQSNDAPGSHVPPSMTSEHSENSSRHRRIDDAVDHQ